MTQFCEIEIFLSDMKPATAFALFRGNPSSFELMLLKLLQSSLQGCPICQIPGFGHCYNIKPVQLFQTTEIGFGGIGCICQKNNLFDPGRQYFLYKGK